MRCREIPTGRWVKESMYIDQILPANYKALDWSTLQFRLRRRWVAWVIGRENQLLYCTQVEGEQMAWNSTSTVIHHQTFAPDRKLLASNQTNNIFINIRTEMIICKINGESFNSVRATKIVCNRLWKMVKTEIDTQICICIIDQFTKRYTISIIRWRVATFAERKTCYWASKQFWRSGVSPIVSFQQTFDILWSRYEFESYGNNSNGLEGKGDGKRRWIVLEYRRLASGVGIVLKKKKNDTTVPRPARESCCLLSGYWAKF